MARKRARQARPARRDRPKRKPQATGRRATRAAREARRAGVRRVLLVVFIPGRAELDGVVTGLLDIGLSATVLESKGLAAVLREEMPMFGALAEMLPKLEGSRVILSATTRALADRALNYIATEVRHGAVAFTVAIDRLIEGAG